MLSVANASPRSALASQRRTSSLLQRAPRRSPAAARPASAAPSLARSARRASRLVAAAQVEEVDPVTGEVISSPARVPLAPNKLQVSGITWAYRTIPVPDVLKSEGYSPVVLLHGLGSSSYSYRSVIETLSAEGVPVYAPDFPGHGNSSKPSPSAFAYDSLAYQKALGQFMAAAPFEKPVVLVVQGFILAQYALLWAYDNPDMIEKLIILNTPISVNTPLPPYLAPYKNPVPFLRPKGVFRADFHNAGGSAYVMQGRDADVYMQPYEMDNAANEALVASLDKCNYKELIKEVDTKYRSWRKDSLVLFGGADRYIEQKTVFDFLETKRTTMKVQTFEAKVGHMPQEDYPEVLCKKLLNYLQGKEDIKVSPGTRIPGNFTDSASA